MKRGMVYPVISALLALLLSSCGDNMLGFIAKDGSDEAKKYNVLQALDKGDYDTVIAELNAGNAGMTEDERYMNLAAAYLGKAGFDVPTLTVDMLNAESNAAAGQDSMKTFMDTLANKASGGGLVRIKSASKNYENVVSGYAFDAKDCSQTANYIALNDLEKDACYTNGLVKIIQATASLSLLMGGADGLASWFKTPEELQDNCADNTNENDLADSAEATSCASTYANFQSDLVTTTCSDVTAEREVDFEKVDGSTQTLTAIEITYISPSGSCADKNIYKIVDVQPTGTIALSSPVITTLNYCKMEAGLVKLDVSCTETDVNYSDINANECWPCPVYSEDGEPLTVAESVTSSLNDGTDALLALIPAQYQDAGLGSAISGFKDSVCTSSEDPTTCTSEGVSQVDIANYLSATQGQ